MEIIFWKMFFAKLNSPSCFLQRPTRRPTTKGTSWFRPQRGPQLANGGNGEGTGTALRGVHRHVWQRGDLPQGRSNLDRPDLQLVRLCSAGVSYQTYISFQGQHIWPGQKCTNSTSNNSDGELKWSHHQLLGSRPVLPTSHDNCGQAE